MQRKWLHWSNKGIASVLIFWMVIFGVSARGAAADYYVSAGGNDLNPGSASEPWRTLQHAADNAVAGDTVVVLAGTYSGFKSKSSGTQALPITIRAQTGQTVILDTAGGDNWHGSIVEIENNDWWIVQGFEVKDSANRAGIDIRVADHVTVRNCYAHHNYKWGIFTAFTDYLTLEYNECAYSEDEHGIYVSNSSDNCTLRYNICRDNNASGIQINADPAMGGDGISSNCVVSHNRIYNNGAAGGAAVNLASVRDALIADNLIYSNSATGIAGWDDGQGDQWGTKNNKIYNNTVHQPSGGRWALSLKNGSTGNTIKNNILVHDNIFRGSLEFDSSSLTGLDSDYNVVQRVSIDESTISLASWQSGYFQDLSSVENGASDLFAVPGSDYHLSRGSPAIDRGVAVPEVTDDIEFHDRPRGKGYDMGAYEYVFPPVVPAVVLLLLN